jgi:methionyl-tRNA formyltransferase
MRLFFVLDETVYHPEFMSEFMKKTADQVVGVAIATKMPDKSSLDKYFIRRWYCFHPLEIIKLLGVKFSMRIKDALFKKTKDGRYFSLRSLCNDFKIDCFDVEYDIHKPEYLNRIREKQPDVIISSNPLIFKKEILTLPKLCCLNRHFALLPSYRGLFAVFHAYAHGEAQTGCSIHMMDEKIDTGVVLSQTRIDIIPGPSLHQLHQKCFNIGVNCLLESLDKVRQGDFTPVHSGAQPSYFSWPTPQEWQQFRQRGGRVI